MLSRLAVYIYSLNMYNDHFNFGGNMSKMGEVVTEFLENGGSELGFSENTLPELDDFHIVLQQMISIWEYKGLTEEEYYN